MAREHRNYVSKELLARYLVEAVVKRMRRSINKTASL